MTGTQSTSECPSIYASIRLKYLSIGIGNKNNFQWVTLQDRVDPDREVDVNSGPTCPIRFDTQEHQTESLADQHLTAAEIEWRRWSGWQMERTARKQFNKKWA